MGGLPVSVGEFQRTYYRQRQMYDRLYQGRLDENMLRQLGIEEQVLEGLVTERLVELETKRLGVTVSDEAVARAIATSPEFQGDGAFIGTEEIRRRLELQGLSEEEFERVAAAPAPAAEPGEPGRRGRLGERRGGGAGVPPPQRAGEARVRARRCRPLPGRGPAGRGRDQGAVRGEEGRLPHSREAGGVVRPARPRDAAAPGGGHRPRHRDATTRTAGRSSARRRRPARATSWSR